MAELDATQMPEDIFSEEVIVDTPELDAVDQEEQEKPKSGGKIQMATEEAKKELAKKYIPRKTIVSSEGEIEEPTPTVVKKATTEISKPVVQKPKEVKQGDLLKPGTQDDAAEYKKKYEEKEVAALVTGKKPSAPVDIKFELDRFLGGSPSSINWDAYDKSKQEEIRRAAAIAVQNDVDPNQDYSGVLTFLSRITPNAIKSGVVSAESDLVSFAGEILKEFEKAKQKPGGFAKSLGVEPEAPKPLADGEVPTYKNLFEIGAKLSKRSEDYMFAAEINSGIQEKNIGKNASDLLFSSEPGDTWDGLTKLGLSVTQQLPQLIGLAATSSNPALMNALMFSTSTGRALTEEYKKDKDISDVDAMQSWGKGLASTLIENLYLGDIKALASAGGKIANLQMNGAKTILKDFLDKNGKEKLRDEIKRTYFGASKDIVKNSFGEGGEEVLTAIADFVVDRTEDGKWDQEEYDKLLSNIKESGLIGTATGFGVSAPLIRASVTPLTTEQKRKVVSFRQVANDPTVSKEIRESAQKHADDIIKFSADQVARKYTVMAALPLEKRKTAIDIAGKIQALENGKAKLKDVEAEAVIDKDIDKLKQDWSKLIVGHAMETAAKDEAARMEAAKTTEVTAETTTPEVKLFNDTPEGRALISNYNATLKALNDKAKILIHSNALAMQSALIQGGMNPSLANAYANGGSHNGVNYSASSGLLATENSNPVIHVNAETADNLTIPHEITHVALADLAKNNPEQFIVMRDKLLKAMSSSNSTPLVAFASQYSKGETSAEAEQLRAEEFIAQMVAELASEGKKIDVNTLQAIAQAIKQFLLDVASKLDSPMLTRLVNDAFANTTSKQELVDFFNKFAEALSAGRSLPTKTPMFDVGISPTRAAETMSNYVRQSILGEKGAAALDEYYNVNTRLNNLYRAKSLTLLGLTPAEIKLSTGWELSSVDDMWRYEIQPTDMIVPNGLLSKALTTGEFVVNRNNGYVVDMESQRELNPNLNESDYKTYKSSFGVSMPIKQILGEYNVYQKAYPDLFDKISVKFKNDPKDGEFAGEYNDDTKTITINLANTSGLNVKSLLIHEMQHAIQAAEGFPVGSNPNVFLGNKEELKAEAQKAFDAYKNLDPESKKLYHEKINISPASIPAFSPYLLPNNETTVEDLNTALNELNKLAEISPSFDPAPLVDLIKSKKFILENGINTKAYEMSAGEIEARTAQERLEMTDEERRGSLIPDNQKIAPEDQIIIRNKIIEGKKQFEKLVEAAAGKSSIKQQIANNPQASNEAAKALSEASGTTQVATTTGSYEKAATILKSLNVSGNVLDYGAGLGLGTDAMSKVLGLPVKSFEINTKRWKGKGKVTYTNANDIDQRFDGIVSLNVVNVVPKDIRDFIVTNIFNNLNIGGTAIISSRKFKGDIDQAKNFEVGAEDKSYIIKRKEDGKIVDVYQKGFDGDELVDYVKELLGDAADVKKNNTFGAAGVVITKKDEIVTKQQIAPNGKPSKLTAAQYNTVRTPEFKAWFGDWENDPENASKMVDENGEPKVYYHGTSKDKDFTAFKMPDNGAWFTESPETASDYAVQNDSQTSKYDWSSGKYLDVNTSPRVLPVFLNIKNPVDYFTTDIITPDDRSKLFGARNYKAVQKELFKKIVYSKTLEERQAGLGVDGLYFEPGVVVALNNPTQIKSATGNKGTFSSEKSDIRQQIFGKPKVEPGTSAAKEAQKKAESTTLKEAWQAVQKEATERNVNVADALKDADMLQTFYNMYNKAGATPFATRMFADAHADIYNKLSKKEKVFLDDIILLQRTIAIDDNFDNRKAAGEKVERPLHTSFKDYATKKEVPLSKEEAVKQLEFLRDKYFSNEDYAKLLDRSNKYFKAFSDILKYKLDNGLIDQGEYDMYKNYNYQPRKFLKFILGDTPQSAFNTRGVQITKEEIKKISEGDTGYMMTDSEKLLKMGFVSAVNKVFTNRAISWMAQEMEGKTLSWLKPANVDKYADGTEKLNPDGSPKLQDPDAGFRNMYYKKDGKRYAVQLKESFAREFQDEEMWDTRNWLYRTATKTLGANVTSAMAVGINPAFIISNIPIDILSQVYYNNLYSSKFGVFGQMGKGFFGAIDKSLSIAKAKTGKGDNSDLLNLINEYGEAGGLMNTLAYETNVLGKVGDALGALGDISEMASKLTAYENKRNDLIREFQKKNGSDPNGVDYDKIRTQAAYEARAAMDYHRGGRTSKWLNGLIPFFNVTTQVGKISATYIKNNFPAFIKKVLQSGGAVMALTLYNMKMAGDDWENEDLKRAKRNKLIIMSPYKNADGTHSYIQIQVPTPIKAFWNVFQTMAEAAYYKGYAPMLGTKIPPVDKDYNKEMMESLKMFMPVATSQIPSTAKFFYEYATNQSLWNQRSLSQDNLRNIVISEEGEENKDVLSFYKTMAKGVSEITDGSIEISPERFQKASEDAFLTSPENQALLAGVYTIADQMTDLYVGGVDENTRSKYIEDGDFTEAGQALLKTFGKRIVGSTDKTKNELFYDSKEDAKFIERLQRKENSARQNVSNKIKTIFKNYKDVDLPYTAAKPEIMEYYKSLTNKEDKEYAKNYIEMSIGKSKVQRTANIPKYLLIAYQAKSAKVKAMAIYEIFTKNGQDPMKDKVLQKDLGSIGFSDEVVKQYKKIVEMEEAKKPAPKADSQAGLPEGFNPADYQPK